MITGVSSGFGHEMTQQLLERGDTVIGTVRNTDKVHDLIDSYPDTFDCRLLDVTDVPVLQNTVREAFERHGRIDVVVSNAGYGLFGCAEELSDAEIDHIIATNLLGSIQFIKTSLPYLRAQGGGRIIQMSTYGAQVAYPANSMYHATKFGIEGFCEAVAQEVAQFNIGVTMVEPGGARTEFRYGSAKVANLMPEYESSHGFLTMLDASRGLAPGDPKRMAECIIASADQDPAPLRVVLGSQALSATIERLETRLADFRTQTELAASTDF
ncbi:oxidoreductase, short chain dehydrogenase/reductase family protein [Bifidobacterium sp. DSM 109957]|uniref:Oxidoreductase, short chain dehydrogenase/reductase family protein n=2 Tax=Bifidobacterium oedipodis TaxID=2675322 RepID=A0A7Y0HQT4_9BIFI|nr:oxidoreductase, short chain dehydrogenase/reductase family protein [Bifidobacterium sp. DSM 109957]